MLSVLISSFFLGLVFNATPGAVLAETLHRGSIGGFKPALAVQLGSLMGDATWAILGLLGVAILVQSSFLQAPMKIGSALYLFWLAWSSWTASPTIGVANSINTTQLSVTSFRSGALLSLTNPQNVLFWAALGNAMSVVGVSNPTIFDYIVFFLGFILASIFWAFFCAMLTARAYLNASQSWVTWTSKICAVLFLVLAIGIVTDFFRLAI